MNCPEAVGRDVTIDVVEAEPDHSPLRLSLTNVTTTTVPRALSFEQVGPAMRLVAFGPVRSCHATSGWLENVKASTVAQLNDFNHRMRYWLLPGVRDQRVLSLGGTIDCDGYGEVSRAAIAALPPVSIAIYARKDGTFLLGSDVERGENHAVVRHALIEREGRKNRLATQMWPVERPAQNGQPALVLAAIKIDRTTFAVTAMADALNLCPTSGAAWYEERQVTAPWAHDGVTRQTAPVNRHFSILSLRETINLVGTVPLVSLLLFSIALMAYGCSLAVQRTSVVGIVSELAASIVIPLMLTACMLLFAIGHAGIAALGPALVVRVVAAFWLLATLSMLWTTRATPMLGATFVLSLNMLVVGGNLVAAQLAFGAPGQGWPVYFLKSLAPLALFATAIVTVSAIRREAWNRRLASIAFGPRLPWLDPRGATMSDGRMARLWDWGFATIPILLTGSMLLAWGAVGTDEGISGVIQPSEYLKFASIVIISVLLVTAYSALLVDDRRLIYYLSLFGVILLLGGALVLVPVMRHDLSPLLIMTISGAGVTFVGTLVASLTWLSTIPERRRRIASPALYDLPYRRWSQIRSGDRVGDWGGRLAIVGILLRFCLGVLALARGRVGWLGRNVFWLAVVLITVSSLYLAKEYFSWEGLPRETKIAIADIKRGISLTKFHSRVLALYDLDVRLPSRRADFPDESDQVRRSRLAIAEAPCHGPEASLGPVGSALPGSIRGFFDAAISVFELGARWLLDSQCRGPQAHAPKLGSPNAASVHDIPVVQNDFIAAFVLNRFGVFTALAFIVAQLCFLTTVLATTLLLLRRKNLGEDRRARRHLTVLVCFGFVLVFGLQCLIAWCNAFGVLLPVMGQPMSFIAYAPSHVLLFALPATCAILIAMRMITETDRCQRSFEDPPQIPWTWFPRRPGQRYM